MTRLTRWILSGAMLVAAPLAAQGRDSIAPEHMPPPGMCRIWLDDVPPNRQPEPTDCPTAIRKRPPNGRVIFGEDVRRTTREDPRLPGGVKQLRGREREPEPEKAKESERKPNERSRRPPQVPSRSQGRPFVVPR